MTRAARVVRLERRVRQLLAVLRLLVALLQVLDVDLARRRIPQAAFQGQPPDETYLGTGDHVPAGLVVARAADRRRRLEMHRARVRCSVCA